MISSFLVSVNPWRRGSKPGAPIPLEGPNLAVLAADEAALPLFVRECPVAMKYLRLLGPLDWAKFPERSADRPWPGPQPQPRAPYVAAFLVKLHQHHAYMSDLLVSDNYNYSLMTIRNAH